MRIVQLETSDHGVGAVLEAVSVLKNGGVIVVPTDTVYGLAADALNEQAVERVFAIKMRNIDQPLPVLVSDFSMMDKVAVVAPSTKKQIEACGSVTAVLPARGWMPLNVRGGQLTIGVRIPTHPFLLQLLRGFGGPLTGTSANTSGRGPYYHIHDIIEEFEGGEEPDLVIDAGDLPHNSVSAVIDFTKTPLLLLRSGPVPKDVLMKLLGSEQ